MKKLVIFIFIAVTSFINDSIANDQIIYDLIDQKNTNSTEMIDLLADWQTNKRNLNEADLKTFPLLDLFQIDKIQKLRNQSNFTSWKDFALRTAFDQETIKLLKNYFIIRINRDLNNQYHYRYRIETRQPLDKAYSNGYYQGSPLKVDHYFKSKIKKNLCIKFRMEKDAGEKSLTDHVTGFIAWKHPKQPLKLILGNYQLNFGLGLTLSSPYGISPNGNPLQAMLKRSDGIKGYSYASESGYFTGMAIAKDYKFCKISGYIASTYLDATSQSENTISTLYTSGYHRTETESNKINQTREKLVGFNMIYQFKQGHIGVVFYKNSYSKKIIPASIQKSYYDFKGKQNFVASTYYHFYLDPIYLSGEIAQSKSKGKAQLHTLHYQSKSLEWILAWRCFDPHFQNFYGYCFYAAPKNIQGFYMGFQSTLTPKIKAIGYCDQWQCKWRSYTIPIPRSGQKIMMQLQLKPIKNVAVKLRWTRKRQDQFISSNEQTGIYWDTTHPVIMHTLRSDLEYRFHKNWKLKTQVSSNLLTMTKREKGFLCYFGIHGKLKTLQLKSRWTIFNTDNWATRLYTYEFDLPGKLSIPGYYNQGNSLLLYLKWKFQKVLNLSIRYRKFNDYSHQEDRHDLGLQMEWKF